MPLYEYLCGSCGAAFEAYLPKWDNSDPACQCGAAPERLMSRFGVVFSGSLHKYMDPKKEGAHMEGFWAYKKLSSISGQPEPVFLDTMESLKAFNKAEGLAAPGDAPTNATISADGKRIQGAGMPGQWASPMSVPSAVWDMTKSLTSLKGKSPDPVASGPACTVQAVDPSMMESISVA